MHQISSVQNGKFYASKQFKCILWSLCPVGCPGRFEASLRAKWFESFEVFLATGKNNLTSLGIRSYSAEKICCAQGHGPWLCGYSVIQQNNHSKPAKHFWMLLQVLPAETFLTAAELLHLSVPFLLLSLLLSENHIPSLYIYMHVYVQSQRLWKRCFHESRSICTYIKD